MKIKSWIGLEGNWKMLVAQTLDKKAFEVARREHLRTAAFVEWQYQLNKNEKLPRGKFFAGKLAGRPVVIMDEAWTFIGGFDNEIDTDRMDVRDLYSMLDSDD